MKLTRPKYAAMAFRSFCRQIPCRDLAFAQRRHIRMVRTRVVVVELRQRGFILGIEVVPFGTRDQREMRTDERDEQHPRLLVMPCGLVAQPIGRRSGDRVVVALIIGISAAGVACELQGRLAHRQRPPDHARRIPDSVDHVQRHDLLGEAVVVRGRTEMELADRRHAMPGRGEPVPPGRHAAVIGHGVVPESGLMGIATGVKAAREGTQIGELQ